jgi:DNA-binding protein YbaB
MFNGIKQFGSQGAAIAKLAMLQKKIQAHKTEVEEGDVKAVVTGDGKLKELYIDGENMSKAAKVINEAITKAQKYSAEEMKDSMGDLSKVLANMPKGMGI